MHLHNESRLFPIHCSPCRCRLGPAPFASFFLFWQQVCSMAYKFGASNGSVVKGSPSAFIFVVAGIQQTGRKNLWHMIHTAMSSPPIPKPGIQGVALVRRVAAIMRARRSGPRRDDEVPSESTVIRRENEVFFCILFQINLRQQDGPSLSILRGYLCHCPRQLCTQRA